MHDGDAFRPPSPKYDEKLPGLFTPAPLLLHAYNTAEGVTAEAQYAARETQMNTNTHHNQKRNSEAGRGGRTLRTGGNTGGRGGQPLEVNTYTYRRSSGGGGSGGGSGDEGEAGGLARTPKPPNTGGAPSKPKNAVNVGSGGLATLKNQQDGGSGSSSSEEDIPSPKYDETTCFFTRPRARRVSRTSRKSLAAANARGHRRSSGHAYDTQHHNTKNSTSPPNTHTPGGGTVLPGTAQKRETPKAPEKQGQTAQNTNAVVGSPAVQALQGAHGGAPGSYPLAHPMSGGGGGGGGGNNAPLATGSGGGAAAASTAAAPGPAAQQQDPSGHERGYQEATMPMHGAGSARHAAMHTAPHQIIPAISLLTPGEVGFTGIGGRSTASRLSMPTPPEGGPQGEDVQPRFRAAVPGKGHELTIISVEVVGATRGQLLPDPRYDRVLGVAMAVWYDHEDVQVRAKYTFALKFLLHNLGN